MTITRRGWPYFRNWLHSRHPAGIDSIQGVLEIAEWYPDSPPWLHVGETARADPYHAAGMLRQLEIDGCVKTVWIENAIVRPGEEPLARLEKIWLTPKGYELLHTLRERSRAGRFRKRFIDSLWTVIVAAATTLATLYIKGCTH